MRKAIIWVVILALLGVVGYRVYKSIESKRMTVREAQEVVEIRVRAEEAKRETVEENISFTGDIEAQFRVTVYSKVGGEIEKLAVDIGDDVRKGDLIAQVEKKKLVLQVERLDASLEGAKINLEKFRKDYERIKSLFEKNAVSQQKMDNTGAAYKSAQAQVKELEASLALAEIQLAGSRICAPIKGTVAKKFIDEGEMIVDASMTKNAPLVTIVDMDIVKVVVSVTGRDIVRVKIGQEARVRVDTYPNRIFVGKVSNISPVLSPLSRTAPVEIEIANSPHLLKPGMFARVKIITGRHENVLVLPIEAIIYQGVKENLFVVEENIARLREVKTGFNDGEMVEILSGLRETEKVIVEGSYGLKNGARVRIK